MEKDEKMCVRVSVRGLVEFILRAGSLDNRRSGIADVNAMQKGGRIHRKIQHQMGPGYQAEVALFFERDYPEYRIRVEGRADGVGTFRKVPMVDEIKGVYLDLKKLEEPKPLHLAQAKCYAHMLCQKRGLERCVVQITYCQMVTEDIRRFREEYTKDELAEWFAELLGEYHKWVEWRHQWKKGRDASMRDLEFPFSYREGQRELVTGVYGAIARRKEIFIQAPTGIGKTMSAVFPAVRAVGEGLGDKIFYLTAKTITRTVAWEAFSLLKERGLSYLVLILTAKEKICANEVTDCNPERCPLADGHFDRVNDAVFALLTSGDSFDRDTLYAHALAYRVCPFEMSLDVATWVDAIICDYNYVFDPDVRLRRFFQEGGKGEHIFLIDEAHNLVSRGREMYSASLYKEDVMRMRRQVKERMPWQENLWNRLAALNKRLLYLKREGEGLQLQKSMEPFLPSVMNVMTEMERSMEAVDHMRDRAFRDQFLEFYFSVRTLVAVSELVDENYVVYTELQEDGRFLLRLFCVNPAKNLQACIDRGASAVFFSATLLPISYYHSLFSTRKDDFALYADSPFDPANRLLLIGRDVSSRYTRRGYDEYRRIADYIRTMVRAREGNYMAFFPSYALMEEVRAVFDQMCREDACRVRVIEQEPSMDEQEREAFLSMFSETEGTLVGFCVMGGIFAEGIDLIGEKLIGAVIIGPGLPQVNPEMELLKTYYDEHGKDGFAYAYRYPGMNKVLQSAGRVIRTAQDRGVILLLDERFLNAEYRSLFPREWSDCRTCGISELGEMLTAFWRDAGKESRPNTL